jgi:hypothetical protein
MTEIAARPGAEDKAKMVLAARKIYFDLSLSPRTRDCAILMMP